MRRRAELAFHDHRQCNHAGCQNSSCPKIIGSFGADGARAPRPQRCYWCSGRHANLKWESRKLWGDIVGVYDWLCAKCGVELNIK